MAGITSLKIKRGDLVYYDVESHTSPEFMMWHAINADGKPNLKIHSHKWKPGSLGLVTEVCLKKDKFLKLVTQEGGVGWVLAAWCTLTQ